MAGSSLNCLALVSAPAAPAIPIPVIWSYLVGGLVFGIGLAAMALRGDWRTARGVDRLILFGPLFYAAPVAAFGTEHFTLTEAMASIMPEWIPWHELWVYVIGAGFVAGALSLVTGILARLSASLLAFTFFSFVVLMHAPGWLQDPGDRLGLTIVLRELSFSGGALALAARLAGEEGARGARVLAAIARWLVSIPVLFFGFEQLMHGDLVPGVPLARPTPDWIFGHAIWTYLAAAVYGVAGLLLLAGKKSRAAATWLGAMVLFVELVVYVPIGIADRASLELGLNYVMDTLMFCGAVLLLAAAMPREAPGIQAGPPPRHGRSW